MADTTYNTHRDRVFNLGFRRGANDRDAAGLPYTNRTLPPPTIPTPPVECATDEDRKSWTNGYSMGYVIGASDRDLQKYDSPKDTLPQPVAGANADYVFVSASAVDSSDGVAQLSRAYHTIMPKLSKDDEAAIKEGV